MKQPDYNRPRNAGDLWLDRSEATCLQRIPYEGKQAPPPKQGRVSMTPTMRGLLINLRKKAGVTSEGAARVAGHTQAWMAHVESGYTQSISEQDFDTLLMWYNAVIEQDRGKAAG